jgi:bacterioferritin-associated ferredoxin
MYICFCRTVTDRVVIAEIHAGARTMHEIAKRCGAGGRCGGCRPEVARLLSRHLEANGPPLGCEDGACDVEAFCA